MIVSFIIPFHNEEKNCRPMLERVLKYSFKKRLNFEIIPIDDRSTDRTSIIIKQFAKKYPQIIFPLFRKGNYQTLGNTMGTALIEGTDKAKGNLIIWTMGDLADDTHTYTAIIDKINNGFDVVFGSRYMRGGSRGNLDPFKAFLSSSGTLIARLLFDIPVHDITNAFRGFKREVFVRTDLKSSDFSISPEFAIKAQLAGFKLGEVPTVYTNRTAGISNFKLYRMVLDYLRLYLELFINFKIMPNAEEN